MMIREIIDKKEIIPIWQDAFGDSVEDIVFFADNVQNAKCFGYYNDGELASMLYFVPCMVDSVCAHYIYAACTLSKYKGNGYMTEILNYCKENFDYICLIPANEGLIDFYNKRNFTFKHDLSSLKFNQINEICQYLTEGCTLNNPFLLVYRR